MVSNVTSRAFGILRLNFALILCLFALTGCLGKDVVALTRSEAYQLGYQSAKKLKETGKSIEDYMNNIESWLQEPQKSTESSSAELFTFNNEGCEALWTLVGLSSAISGASTVTNTPENQSDFIQGCLDGGNN